jgi:hypothetical protein
MQAGSNTPLLSAIIRPESPAGHKWVLYDEDNSDDEDTFGFSEPFTPSLKRPAFDRQLSSFQDEQRFKAWRDRSRFSYSPLFIVPMSESLSVRVTGELFVSLVLNPIFGPVILLTELWRMAMQKERTYREFNLYRLLLLLYHPASSFALFNLLLFISHNDEATVSTTEVRLEFLSWSQPVCFIGHE